MLTLRVYPPRREFDFTHRACPTPRPKLRLEQAKTFSIPPLCSLPQVMKPKRPSPWQPTMTTLRHGTPRRRPSSSRPDLMATLSSPQEDVQLLITTRSHDSGSHASLVC